LYVVAQCVPCVLAGFALPILRAMFHTLGLTSVLGSRRMVATVKHLHLLLVTVSVLGFVLRFLGSVCGAAWVRSPVGRVLPHIVDTVLLLSGVSLLWITQLNPLSVEWLSVKLLLLVAYVVFGALAMRAVAQGGATRWLFFGLAVAVVVQMVGIALRHHPWGWFA